jgi:1-acyl-sn-glycerol-3-phosphate acyltransferase
MSPFRIDNLSAPTRMMILTMQRFWFIWCSFVFLATGLGALGFYMLIFNLFEREKATQYTYIVTKWWGKILLAFMLVRVTSEGTEHLQEENSCVIVSNHLSMCDIPVCMATSPTNFSFLAKKEADRVPVVGYLARNMHVYVDRKSKQSRKETAERMQQHLYNGNSILIYPEGTRNTSEDPLNSFYDGAFKLAIETQKPLVITTICGSQKISTPKHPFRASPAWVHTIWEEPISTVGMTLEDIPRLKEITRARMIGNLEGYYAEYPA